MAEIADAKLKMEVSFQVNLTAGIGKYMFRKLKALWAQPAPTPVEDRRFEQIIGIGATEVFDERDTGSKSHRR
ncbi:MAG: hypothetical protein ACD_23C00984G0007 [uncultured bacterium]|jgi:hypothetical protein|nr:MAG: hypothetical protein ACD_23C00984G0007 [uncultured bacterium]